MAGRNSVDIKTNLDTKAALAKLTSFENRLTRLTGAEYTIKISVAQGKLNSALTGVTNIQRAMLSLDKTTAVAMSGLGLYGSALRETKGDVADLDTKTRELRTDVGALGKESRSAGKDIASLGKSTKAYTSTRTSQIKQTRQATQAVKEHTDALDAGNLAIFRAQSLITGLALNTYIKNLRDALTELKAVDTELVTIQKVTGQTREQLQGLADDAFSVASKYGTVASDYLSSVASFARAGYADQADALGELSMMTQKVGDVNADVADQFLLSVDAAYQYEGSIKELSKVLDGANEIGNKFATDVNKITAGLGIVSNVAKQANVDIDEVTAALGTITAVTQRSGSEAARALRAIYLNIAADISTEIDEDTGDHWTAEEIDAMSTSLQKFGIYTRYVKDGMEQLRNPMEVIGELAAKVKAEEISEVELNDLLQSLGGKLRSNQLLALISNWEMYEKMLATYRTAAGSAEEELSIYLESWEAKAEKLSAAWAELVNNTVNSSLIKWFLDSATAILESSDSLVTFTGALGGLLMLINSNRISSVLGGVAEGIKSIVGSVKGMFSGGTLTLSGGIGIAGALTTAVSLVAMAVENYENSQKKAREEAIKLGDAIGKERIAASDLSVEYGNLLTTSESAVQAHENIELAAREVINALGFEKTEIDELIEKYGTLEAVTAASKISAQKGIEDARAATNAQFEELVKNTQILQAYMGWSEDVPTFITTDKNGTAGFSHGGSNPFETFIMNPSRDQNHEPERLYASYEDLIQWYQAVEREHRALETSGEVTTERFRTLDNVVREYRDGIASLTSSLGLETKLQYEATHGLIDSQEELDDYVRWMWENVDAHGSVKSAIAKSVRAEYDFEDATEDTNEAIKEKVQQLKEEEELARDVAGHLSDATDALTAYNEKYTQLNDIVTSFNETGELTVEQFKQIVDNGLLNYLDEVDGKLVLNEEALLNDADAARQKAEQDVRAAWAADLLAFAEGRVNEMSAGGQGAVKGFGDAISSAGDQAASGASGFLKAAMAIETTRGVLEGKSLSDFNSGIDSINRYYEGIIGKLGQISFGGSTRRTGGGSGGGSSRSSEKSNTYIDILKQLLADADYQIEAWTRDGDKEEAILAMYDREMREIEAIIAKYREQGYDDTSDEIQELQKLWWKYADAVEDVHEDLAKRVQDTWKELEDQVDDMVGGRTDALDEQLDELEDKYDKLLEELETAYDAQVDALEEARDTEQEQLDLEEKRLAVLEAQQALLAAQNDRTVRKYNADGTWEWVADERAIQSAQEALTSAEQDLADYEADLELNATKEALKAEYEANKAALEAERDEQIAAVEAEKEAFETEWNAIKDAIVEPGRDIGEILSEIATNGTPAMKEQVDNITALLGKLGYDVAAVAGTTYGGTVSSEDSERIKKFLTGDYSGAVFDSGGVAGMKGIMLKDTSDAETVLPPSLTKAIISPERNALFSNFTDALTRMFGISERVNLGATPIPNSFGGRDSHDTSYTINGIRIGSDEAQRPFYEVMRHIAVYSNMN